MDGRLLFLERTEINEFLKWQKLRKLISYYYYCWKCNYRYWKYVFYCALVSFIYYSTISLTM